MVALASRLPLHVRRALRPPDRLTPCTWAEQYRILSRQQSSRFGRWRHSTAPCLVLYDLPFKQRQIRKLNIKKHAQGGWSEGARNVLGYMASEEPDPCLLVLPDENAGKTIFGERIIPLFDDTPRLKDLETGASHDKKLTQVTLLNGFTLRLAWSGSPASLASHPVRVVMNDEIDKMAQWSGAEASPIALAEVRTATYDNSLILNISTPTTRDRQIHNLEENSAIRLRFYVPCPHCGTFQMLAWDRLTWNKGEPNEDKATVAARIMSNPLMAWYPCAECGEKIFDHHRAKMLNAGFWGLLNEDGVSPMEGTYRLYADGRQSGQLPPGDEVGIQISALYDLAPKHRLHVMAADFVKAKGDLALTMNFYNSTLGEVFEQQTATRSTSVFAKKCIENAPPAKMLQPWVSRVLITVDTQKDHFWYVVRGWGHGRRSHRIMHGRCSSFDDLRLMFDQSQFRYVGDCYPPMRIHALGIDSGGGKMGLDYSRTDQVYRFCQGNNFFFPLKGESEPQGASVRPRRVNYQPPDRKRTAYSVFLHLLDTQFFNDVLDTAITGRVQVINPTTGELTEEDQWLLDSNNDEEEYNRHLANMHKVMVRKGKQQPVERWGKKTEGARVDLRACEVYQWALVEITKTDLLPPAEVLQAERAAARAHQAPKMTTPDGRPFLVTQR